ncbi:MAG: Bax inhibitor-1/YccA family protein [Actinomycetota bacterium]|nr:Bax inhibitor-1/YccA family protein [Actinomycetota bacterium]MDQ2957991.1 Bax inhibitor-1/YccA family protein [Actinomycetota bacterium]
MASNPVLRGFEKTGRPGVPGQNGRAVPPPPSASQLNEWYTQPSFGQPPAPAAPSRYLTLDDVITRSVLLIGTMIVAAGVAWFAVPDSAIGAVVAIGIIGALGLGLYMGFSGKANAATTVSYAVLEGLALGGISELFNRQWPGIVVQAITGTMMVAGGVLVVYKTGAVRVTPKFTKIVFAATLGVFGLMLVNVIASIFTPGGLGLRDANTNPVIAIGFSLLCIVIAASNLILDFDMIEQSVRRGVDEKYGWYLSWGLLVTLVWLYLEILRLLSYLTGRNN